MKKRLMVRILSAVLIVLFFTVNGGMEPKVAQAAVVQSVEVDGVMWNYSVDYTGEAVDVEPVDKAKMGRNGTITSIIIPESLGGKKVASIKSYAFENCTNLTSITIPESVKSIGMYAFNQCDSLTSITIPKNVTTIGYSAFGNTGSLKEILVSEDNQEYTSVNGVLHDKKKNILLRYPEGKEEANYKILDSVTMIGKNAFSNCKKLSSIDIHGGLTSIYQGAFNGCKGITSITIPDGVTRIESKAFNDCQNLTSITMPKGITSIDEFLFRGCYRLASITIPQKVTNIGEGAFSECYALSNVIISDEVTSIGNDAFNDCRSLPSITIPEKVTSIGDYAFNDCDSLMRINMPNSVTNIGCAAFASKNLKEILVSNDNTRFESVNGVLYNKQKTRIIAYPSGKYEKDYSILESITSIGDGAFYQCSNLTSIIIPKGVTSIGKEAFCDCWGLESIIIPEGVTSIGELAFKFCSELESIIIPEGVTSIGKSAFYYCLGLESIIIPEGINIIKYGTFTGCVKLKNIIIPEGVTKIEDYAFENCASLNYISVPCSVSFISDRALNGGKDNLITIYADIDSYASKFKWGNNVVIDTNIGYISGKVKDDAKTKLFEGKNALLTFVNDGGLSADNLFINLNTEIDNYSTIELIDGETDIKALKLWTLNLDEKIKALNFEVSRFTTGVASPQFIETEITLTTESSGRLETMETKYEVYDGNTWTVLKDYSSEVTAIWKPQKAGIYKINATVKDGTGRKIVKSLDYIINKPLIISSFNANVLSPQTLGTKITLTAKSSGGIGIAQTKFTIDDGSTSIIIKNYSVEGSTVWTPTKAGTYKVYASVKDETGKEVTKTLNYVINPAIKINSFTTNVLSPQTLGTKITLTAQSSGGTGTLQTKFTIKDGLTSKIIKNFSVEGSTVWTPTKAGTYKVYASVKDETGKVVTKSFDYVINPIKYSCEVNGIVWNYEVDDTDNADDAVNVYPSDKTLTSVKIPSTLEGKKVTSIKEGAFLNCGSLSSISIPEGVTSIGKEIFKNCTSLKIISIPSSVTDIGSTAFENCVKLTTIYTNSSSYASGYNWKYGAVDTKIGYTKGSLIIELGNYDTNSDGTVNIIDLANVAKSYNTSKSDVNWQEQYDYNYDGMIDIYDLVKISKKIK